MMVSNYWVIPAINRDYQATVIDDVIAHIETITKTPLTTKGRYRTLCEGRQLAAYIMRVKFGMSLQSIGDRLGIDHSTVVYAIKTISAFIKMDKMFVSRWKDIIEYAEIESIKVETEESNSKDLPTVCGECSAYQIRSRMCALRFINVYDRKPIVKDCKGLPIRKRT